MVARRATRIGGDRQFGHRFLRVASYANIRPNASQTGEASAGLLEDADSPKPRVALLDELARRLLPELRELIAQRSAQARGRRLPVAVGPADRLGHDGIDDAQAQQGWRGHAHPPRPLGGP